MLHYLKTHHRFMWRYTRGLVQSFQRPVIIFLIFFSATLSLIYSTLFYFIELNQNPQMQHFFDAYYFTVTTFTGVGFGDIHPVTIAGKVLSIVMMFSGTALFVSFTATVATALFEIEMRHSKSNWSEPNEKPESKP